MTHHRPHVPHVFPLVGILERLIIMTQAIDDLPAAENALSATTSSVVSEIASLVSQLSAVNNDPAIEALVTQITAENDKLAAAVASATPAPPAPPAP